MIVDVTHNGRFSMQRCQRGELRFVNGKWAPRSQYGRRCRQLKQAMLEPIGRATMLGPLPRADPMCISIDALELAMRRAAACNIHPTNALMRRAREKLEAARAAQAVERLGEAPPPCAAQEQVLLGDLMQVIGGFLRPLERHRLMRVCTHWQSTLPPPGRAVVEALERVLSGERLRKGFQRLPPSVREEPELVAAQLLVALQRAEAVEARAKRMWECSQRELTTFHFDNSRGRRCKMEALGAAQSRVAALSALRQWEAAHRCAPLRPSTRLEYLPSGLQARTGSLARVCGCPADALAARFAELGLGGGVPRWLGSTAETDTPITEVLNLYGYELGPTSPSPSGLTRADYLRDLLLAIWDGTSIATAAQAGSVAVRASST